MIFPFYFEAAGPLLYASFELMSATGELFASLWSNSKRPPRVRAKTHHDRGGSMDYDANEHMDNRLKKLEDFAVDTRERLARLEARIEQIFAEMLTKAEFAQQITRLMQFFIVTLVSVLAVMITVMTFVLNYAAPPRVAAVPSQPTVVINR
jgi:hypothetical protein